MIKGMTGFGSAQLSKNKVKAAVEIRTVNHRYFDVSYYMPTGFGSYENKVRQLIQKNIQRGRITVSIRITQQPERTAVLDRGVVKAYLKNIHSLQKEFKLKDDIKISDIISLPGVFETKEIFVARETLWPDLEKCLKKALAGLVIMRKREGKSLEMDVSDKLRRMLLQTKKIEKALGVILKGKKKVLGPDEFLSFQKSTDVNEEIIRLNHFVAEMKKLLKATAPVGKQMDFIAQEMQRETNTIGSKIQDKVVSNAVIALKGKIEKIREQAQNVE
ncbi:Protein YicC [hydrothermal vent metagenome]|uniref:Protein YicC n=1 Tax=hydrothermal vent metagenome TaxID=652676 RepID=A0A3B1DL23_9ZZZZ